MKRNYTISLESEDDLNVSKVINAQKTLNKTPDQQIQDKAFIKKQSEPEPEPTNDGTDTAAPGGEPAEDPNAAPAEGDGGGEDTGSTDAVSEPPTDDTSSGDEGDITEDPPSTEEGDGDGDAAKDNEGAADNGTDDQSKRQPEVTKDDEKSKPQEGDFSDEDKKAEDKASKEKNDKREAVTAKADAEGEELAKECGCESNPTAVDVVDQSKKVEDASDAVIQALEDVSTLTSFQSRLVIQSNNFGTDTTTLKMINIGCESISNRYDGEPLRLNVSLESNVSSQKIKAAKLAAEGIGDWIASIWKAIIDTCKSIINWIKNLFSRVFGYFEQRKKDLMKAKERLNKITATELPKDENGNPPQLMDSGIIRALFVTSGTEPAADFSHDPNGKSYGFIPHDPLMNTNFFIAQYTATIKYNTNIEMRLLNELVDDQLSNNITGNTAAGDINIELPGFTPLYSDESRLPYSPPSEDMDTCLFNTVVNGQKVNPYNPTTMYNGRCIMVGGFIPMVYLPKPNVLSKLDRVGYNDMLRKIDFNIAAYTDVRDAPLGSRSFLEKQELDSYIALLLHLVEIGDTLKGCFKQAISSKENLQKNIERYMKVNKVNLDGDEKKSNNAAMFASSISARATMSDKLYVKSVSSISSLITKTLDAGVFFVNENIKKYV